MSIISRRLFLLWNFYSLYIFNYWIIHSVRHQNAIKPWIFAELFIKPYFSYRGIDSIMSSDMHYKTRPDTHQFYGTQLLWCFNNVLAEHALCKAELLHIFHANCVKDVLKTHFSEDRVISYKLRNAWPNSSSTPRP